MSAPGWLTYAALVLSSASLVVSVLAYCAGGPRLSLRARRLAADAAGNPFPEGAAVRLTVVNAGRAAVTVEGFHVTPYGNRKPVVEIRDVDGPVLPFRLEAHASESWCVDALPAAREYDALVRSGRLTPNSSWPSQFNFTVAAGNGKTARDRSNVDSLRIIADARD